MDLTALTDIELADHLNAVLAEQERRQRLATIPAQIAAMTSAYVDGGGDGADLVAAVTEAVAVAEAATE